MRKLMLIFLLILFGCDDGASFDEIQSFGTEREYDLLDQNIRDIQERMNRLGVDINLRQISYKIFEGVLVEKENIGACFKKEGIVLNKELFQINDGGLESKKKKAYWKLWTTLLHEIGHCFFELEHYVTSVEAPSGYAFIHPEYVFGENSDIIWYGTSVSSYLNIPIMATKFEAEDYYFESHVNSINDTTALDEKHDLYILEIAGQLRFDRALETILEKTKIKLISFDRLFQSYEGFCEESRVDCYTYGDVTSDRYYTNWFKSEVYEDVPLYRRSDKIF